MKQALRKYRITRRLVDDDDDLLLEVHRLWLKGAHPKKAQEKFEADLAAARTRPHQWDAAKLLDVLFPAVQKHLRTHVGVVFITHKDIYTDKYNYLFGYGGKPAAIVSYARFLASANPSEKPDWRRMQSRALKQVLSSGGYSFGVPQCKNPPCARTYPNSVQQQDDKPSDLCRTCKAAFHEALGKNHP